MINSQPAQSTIGSIPAVSKQTDALEPVEIKALNPDNLFEIEQLIQLYLRSYGNSYPHKGVYSSSYWIGQSRSLLRSQKFVNLAEYRNRKMVGHLGLRLDPAHGGAEIISLAVDPADRQNIFQTARQAWQLLERQAARHACRSIHFFCPLKHPALQVLARKCFHCWESAILPGYLHSVPLPWSSFGEKKEVGVVVMQNFLQPELKPPLPIYPPERHFGMISHLYQTLGPNRDLRSAGTSPLKVEPAGPASGIEVEYRRRYRAYHISIMPSQAPLSGLEECLQRLGQTSDARIYLQVRLDNQNCPGICSFIESLGYHFCGVMPELKGHDYVIYARVDPTAALDEGLYSQHAKQLWKYILDSRLQ